jgi:hypothetical protein
MSHFAQTSRGRAHVKENQAPRAGKASVLDTKASRVTKRTVLGSISNNVRVQPSRAAKVSKPTVFSFTLLMVEYCDNLENVMFRRRLLSFESRTEKKCEQGRLSNIIAIRF